MLAAHVLTALAMVAACATAQNWVSYRRDSANSGVTSGLLAETTSGTVSSTFQSSIGGVLFRNNGLTDQVTPTAQSSSGLRFDHFCPPQDAVFVVGNEVISAPANNLSTPTWTTTLPLAKRDTVNHLPALSEDARLLGVA